MAETTNQNANSPASEDLSGQILDGEVTGITSFGAFVKLSTGHDGLVHISEIADTYVNNVADFVNNGDKIKVKVLGKNKKGKYDLSIKKVGGNQAVPMKRSTPSYVRSPKKGRKDRPIPNSFEDKIDQFLKRSEEKQLDLKRNIQSKQGIKKRTKKE